MALGKRSSERALQKVLGRGADVNADNPLEVHDPKVGSLISYEGTTTADGADDGSSLIDSVLTTKPDYDGNLVIITSGAYAGQARDIDGTTTGTVNPTTAFGGQILRGTNFVIVALRLTPAEVAAIEAKLDHEDHGLAALKALIDAIEGKVDLPAANETANTKIGEVIGQKGDAANETASQASIIGLLRAVITTYLADGTIGLSNLKALIDAVEAKLDHEDHGLAALKALIDAIEGKVDLPAANETANTKIGEVIGQKGDAANETASQASIIGLLRAVITTYLSDGTIGLSNLKALIDAVEAKLDHETTGLSALKDLIDAIEGKVDLPAANETANTKIGEVIGQKGDAANETASQASIIGLLRAVITTYLNDGSIGLGNLKTLIDAIETKLDTPANFMADVSDLATILALVDSAESVGPFSYLDAGLEQDVVEDTATTRREISLEFSNRNMTQTGTFIIYRKVDGANYDVYETVAVTVGAGDDRAFDIIFMTNQAWKLTYEEGADEGAARAIPFNVITQVKE